MNAMFFRQKWLQTQIFLQRSGWPAYAICLCLIVMCVVGTTSIQNLRFEIMQQRGATARAERQLKTPKVRTPLVTLDPSAQNLAAFYAALGNPSDVEDYLKTVLAVAAKNNIRMQSAEYVLGQDKEGGYVTYQMLFPIKGTYSAIRAFCDQTLLALPFASLTDISFKRDAIGNPSIDAKVRMTLYLLDGQLSQVNVNKSITHAGSP
jgi:hypothetical protein